MKYLINGLETEKVQFILEFEAATEVYTYSKVNYEQALKMPFSFQLAMSSKVDEVKSQFYKNINASGKVKIGPNTYEIR